MRLPSTFAAGGMRPMFLHWDHGHATGARRIMNSIAIIFRRCALAAALLLAAGAHAQEEARTNYFNDPFLQVTNAIAACPRQEGPKLTRREALAESHWRAERGGSCYRDGRCRLPNAYLYDEEIIPRVKKAILADARFADTSVWIEGQRRWVWLKGCVQSQEQSAALEQLVRNIDDVEAVINQLAVKRK
jgi:hypothetical protein